MKKLLLQKEREDVTSSHKVSQIRNESSASIKNDHTVDASHGPNFVPNIVSPRPLTTQHLNAPLSSATELHSIYGKHEYEKAMARHSSASTGTFPGMHPVQEAPAGVVTSGHTSTVQMNGTLFQTTKNTDNRQEYLRTELTAASTGRMATPAGPSGARYYADKQMSLQQPPPLTWIGKYSPFNTPQSMVESSSNRFHGSTYDDSMTRYAVAEDSRAESSCASNTAEEYAESIRDVSEDSRQEFDDNTSDEFLRPHYNTYHGDTSTRDTDSPVSHTGSETFKSPGSMKSGHSRFHAGRTARSSSSNAGISGNSKSSSKIVSDGSSVSGGRSIIRCPICGKLFNNSSALAKHKLTHSDERKYTCNTCSKSFKRQDHLNGHMMTHSSKKPFECKFIGCSKSYCDARSLRRHLENHHQDFISTSNGASGSVLSSLAADDQSNYSEISQPEFGNGVVENDSRHRSASPFDPKQIWTTGYNPLDEPKPVKCHICDRGFKNIAALNGHMRLHGGYVRKDNAETKSEMNEPMEGVYHTESQASRGSTPQLSTSGSRQSGMQELAISGVLNHVLNSSSVLKEEPIERNEPVDHSSFATFRYHNKDGMPDLLRNTSEGYTFSGHTEPKGFAQKNNAVLGSNIPCTTPEANSLANMFNAGLLNMKKETLREGYMPHDASSKSRLYDDLLLWSKMSQNAKYGGMTDNYGGHVAREMGYNDQIDGSNILMGRTPNSRLQHLERSADKRDYFGQHHSNLPFQSSHLDAKASMMTSGSHIGSFSAKPHTTASGLHSGNEKVDDRKILNAYGSTQQSRSHHFLDTGKLISLPSSEAYNGFRSLGKGFSDIQDSMSQVASTDNFRSTKSNLMKDSLISNRSTAVSNRMLKSENIAETSVLDAPIRVPSSLNSATNRSNDGCVPQPLICNRVEDGKKTFNDWARLDESRTEEKLSTISCSRGSIDQQAASSPTLSPDGDKLSSSEADKADSLYRRRVKNLKLKHGGELAKAVDCQSAINSPRLGGRFAIPSADPSIQDNKLTAFSDIGCEAQLKVVVECASQASVPTAYCETGSPCQTRISQVSALKCSNFSSDITSCAVSGTLTNDSMRNECCMQFEKIAVSSCPAVCGLSSVIGYSKTDLPYTTETKDICAAADLRQCCSTSVTSCDSPHNFGEVQHKISADQDIKLCADVKSTIGRCYSTQYPYGCSKVTSHPNTPSCAGDAVFMSTRLVGCCSKNQASTPTCHGAGRCSGNIRSDIGVVECAHGQRTPVVLHCQQVVAFTEHAVHVGCCQPSFAVPPSPCDHRQQVIMPRTPCMAHTPRDHHTHHCESERQDACTQRDGHCQHSCRTILTPAATVTTQPCHFQFPPCVTASCEAVLLRSPYASHAAYVPCCTPCASPHCNHQPGSDRGHSRQTCNDDDVFDAVMSCDRDRERLMKLVELEVEERLKLRRQSEVEEAEKSSTQKENSRKGSSTPVEPDSTVSTDYTEEKYMSDNETESSDTEVGNALGQQVERSEADGEAISSNILSARGLHKNAVEGLTNIPERKRKHAGEDCAQRNTGSLNITSNGISFAPLNSLRPGESRLQLEMQVTETCSSAKNKRDSSNDFGRSIKHRPWVECESRNGSNLHSTELPSVHVEKLLQQDPHLTEAMPENVPAVSGRSSRLHDDDSTGEQLAKRSKKRPHPLVIPPNIEKESSVLNVGYQSWLRSPCLQRCANILPYTPPPMLSPARSGSGLFWTLNEAFTATVARPSEQTASTRREDYEDDDMPLITDTTPHINVGSQFQAQLPSCSVKRATAVNDDEKATLVWHPAIAKKLGKFAVHDYEQYSCSAVIPGNGPNREYAFHLLHQCRGNMKKAMKLLMNREPKMPSESTLQSYYYEECTEWKPNEIESFKNAILKCDKDFCQIAKRVGSKTRGECVQFYYVWKKLNVEDYRRLRVLRRRREQSELYKLRATSIK